jgi:hypothetical protein
MFERESALAPHLSAGFAPRLLWQVRTENRWLLGFEHVTGHPADFSPRSPDCR